MRKLHKRIQEFQKKCILRKTSHKQVKKKKTDEVKALRTVKITKREREEFGNV